MADVVCGGAITQGKSRDYQHVQDEVDERLRVDGLLVERMRLVRLIQAHQVDNDQETDVDQNDNGGARVVLQQIARGGSLKPREVEDVLVVHSLEVGEEYRWR